MKGTTPRSVLSYEARCMLTSKRVLDTTLLEHLLSSCLCRISCYCLDAKEQLVIIASDYNANILAICDATGSLIPMI